MQSAVAGLVGDAQNVIPHAVGRIHQGRGGEVLLIPHECFDPIGDLHPGFFSFPTHDYIDIGLFGRFKVQVFVRYAGMRSAENDGDIMHRFDLGGVAPGLFDLWRVGGDANQVGSKLLDEFIEGLIFYISIENTHLVATTFGHSAQIGKAEMG